LLSQAKQWLAQAHRVVVLTGAGVSAESGVPTFRGSGGLWRDHRPEDLATLDAFLTDPRLVWEWYAWRRERIAAVEPNAGHRALVEMEASKSDFLLATQNVDGLHDRAGSRNVRKLHGDIWVLRCLECRREWKDDRVKLPELPPRCGCGGLARPGVVWFGEPLPEQVWRDVTQAIHEAEVFLVAGTSAVVYPAAALVPLARRSGARVIEVNLEATPHSETADVSLRGRAGEILPQLIA
jgi:NAD-dependent deacetylase